MSKLQFLYEQFTRCTLNLSYSGGSPGRDITIENNSLKL